MKNKGFTLIELMLTVAIIGVLTAVAIPSLHEWAESANHAELSYRAHLKACLRENELPLANCQENAKHISGWSGQKQVDTGGLTRYDTGPTTEPTF